MKLMAHGRKSFLVWVLTVAVFMVMLVPAQGVCAAGTPAPTVSKKTLYVGGDNYKIRFNNLAAGAAVSYKSSDAGIATVTKTGVIKPVAKGKATVTVTMKQSGKTYTSSIAVTVINPYVKITNAPATLKVGDTCQLEAKIYGLKKTSVSWAVSDKKLAAIDAKTRMLTALAAGTVKITFKDKLSGKYYSVSIVIEEEEPEEELEEDELFGYEVKDGAAILTEIYDTSVTSLVIPNSFGKYKVTAIGDGALEGLYDLTAVKIPSTVTDIGEDAFSYCSSLKTIELPSGLKSLGAGAFEACEALTTITIPDGITAIGDDTFYGCAALKSIKFGKAIKEIGSCAFYECVSLTQVSIPSSVKTIGSEAFAYCEKLGKLTFSSGLTLIEDSAFAGCIALTTVNLPSTLKELGYSAFDGCEALKSVLVPSSVEDIGSGAFDYCSESLKLKVKKNSAAHEFAVDYEISFSIY